MWSCVCGRMWLGVCVRSYVFGCVVVCVLGCVVVCVCLFDCRSFALQVQHEEAPPEEWLQLPGKAAAKQASVTLMLRTALFAHARARLGTSTPSPVPVFHALRIAFREVMASHRFVLPTMDEVVSCETPKLSSV